MIALKPYLLWMRESVPVEWFYYCNNQEAERRLRKRLAIIRKLFPQTKATIRWKVPTAFDCVKPNFDVE